MNTGPGISELPYSPRAEQVIRKATKEATDRNQNFIGSEHFLMAIIRMQEGAAFEVINILNSKMFDLSTSLDMEIGRGPDQDHHQLVPSYTPRAKKVLSLATKEARKYSHKYIGTENILLAIMADEEGVPFKVLISFGFTYEKVRDCVLEVLSSAKPDQQSTPKTEEIMDNGTMSETDKINHINRLIRILELDSSSHSESLCRHLELLKHCALMDLNDLGEFNGDEGLERLIDQLFRDDRGPLTQGWFKGMVTKESTDLIVEILRRNHGDTAVEKLRKALNLTDYRSEEEIRISRILQVLTNSDTIERTILIHR